VLSARLEPLRSGRFDSSFSTAGSLKKKSEFQNSGRHIYAHSFDNIALFGAHINPECRAAQMSVVKTVRMGLESNASCLAGCLVFELQFKANLGRSSAVSIRRNYVDDVMRSL